MRFGLTLEFLSQSFFCLVCTVQQVWCFTQHRLMLETISVLCNKRQRTELKAHFSKSYIQIDKEGLTKIIFPLSVFPNWSLFSPVWKNTLFPKLAWNYLWKRRHGRRELDSMVQTLFFYFIRWLLDTSGKKWQHSIWSQDCIHQLTMHLAMASVLQPHMEMCSTIVPVWDSGDLSYPQCFSSQILCGNLWYVPLNLILLQNHWESIFALYK